MALNNEEIQGTYNAAYGVTFGEHTTFEGTLEAYGDAHTTALQAVARAVAADCARMLDDAEDTDYDTGQDGSSDYTYTYWSSGEGAAKIYASTPGDFIRKTYGVTE